MRKYCRILSGGAESCSYICYEGIILSINILGWVKTECGETNWKAIVIGQERYKGSLDKESGIDTESR